MAALIFQESQGVKEAFRFEPKFFENLIKNLPREKLSGFVPIGMPTLATEKFLRACSFGYCQVLGETFRWRGYKGIYLTECFDTETNLEYGVAYLRWCYDKYPEKTVYRDRIKAALSLYNGIVDHKNSQYDEKVLSHVENGNYKYILHPS